MIVPVVLFEPCRECGGTVVRVDTERKEDELRSNQQRVFYRAGAVFTVCEHGHKVLVREDPGPGKGVEPITWQLPDAVIARWGPVTQGDAAWGFGPGCWPECRVVSGGYTLHHGGCVNDPLNHYAPAHPPVHVPAEDYKFRTRAVGKQPTA